MSSQTPFGRDIFLLLLRFRCHGQMSCITSFNFYLCLFPFYQSWENILSGSLGARKEGWCNQALCLFTSCISLCSLVGKLSKQNWQSYFSLFRRGGLVGLVRGLTSLTPVLPAKSDLPSLYPSGSKCVVISWRNRLSSDLKPRPQYLQIYFPFFFVGVLGELVWVGANGKEVRIR